MGLWDTFKPKSEPAPKGSTWNAVKTGAGTYRLENEQGLVLADETDAILEWGGKGSTWKTEALESGKLRLVRCSDGAALVDEQDQVIEFDPPKGGETGLEALEERLGDAVPGFKAGPATRTEGTEGERSGDRLAAILGCSDLGRAALARIRAGQLDVSSVQARAGLDQVGAPTRSEPERSATAPKKKMSEGRMAELLGMAGHTGRDAMARIRKGELSLDALNRQIGLN